MPGVHVSQQERAIRQDKNQRVELAGRGGAVRSRRSQNQNRGLAQSQQVGAMEARVPRKAQRGNGPWNPATTNGGRKQTCQLVSFGSPVICIR